VNALLSWVEHFWLFKGIHIRSILSGEKGSSFLFFFCKEGCQDMRKAFRYRVYPTKKQETLLNEHLARCCELYNAALQECKFDNSVS
jgi:hypothetical protein